MDAGIGDERSAMRKAGLATFECLLDQDRRVEIGMDAFEPKAPGPCAAFSVPITSMAVSFPGNREAFCCEKGVPLGRSASLASSQR